MSEKEIRLDWEKALASVDHGSDLSQKIGWGFTKQDLLVLMCFHKAGRFMTKIVDLLEDCNFHTECGMMDAGEYETCLETIMNDD